MRTAFLSAVLSLALPGLAGCGQPPSTETTPPAPSETSAPATVAPAGKIEGWEAGGTAYPLLNQTLPAFDVKQADGRQISSESLRNRWTILGVWADDAVPPDEARFAEALNSAVNQDPDLDLLVIHRQPTGALLVEMPPWPALMDDGTVAASLGVPARPAYLLIGPDLTIEGYRGALSATPEDGIKSVIRGVHEIRKQIAAPQ